MNGEPDEAPPTRAELQTAAVRGSIWASLSVTFTLPLAFIANLIVARLLGPIQFGHLATLMAAYTIALTVASAGVDDATIQWGAGTFAAGNRTQLIELVRRCAGYHLFVQAPVIAVVTAVLLRHAPWEVVVVGSAAAAGTMIMSSGAVAQTVLSRTATAARVALASSIALQVLVVTAAISSKSGTDTWAGRLVGGVIGPLILIVLLPPHLRSAILRPRLPRRWPRGFVPFAFKAAAGGIVATLVFSRSELFVLQAHGLAVDAGVYALGFGIAAHLTAPIDSVLAPMLPAAASLAIAGPERLGEALLRGLRFTALVAGGLAAFAIPLASGLIPAIYGRRFAADAQLLLPLGLVSCVQSLNHPVTAFMYGLRRIGSILMINSAAFAVDIAIAIATVGALHAWGATLANAVGQLISLGAAGAIVRRRLRIPWRMMRSAITSFIQGSAAAILGWVAATRLHGSGWPPEAHAALGTVVAGVIFVLAQRLGRPALSAADTDVLANGLPSRLRQPTRAILAALGMT